MTNPVYGAILLSEREVKTMTLLVLTIAITAISFVANKMVQEIKRYNEALAKAEARERRRQEALAAR